MNVLTSIRLFLGDTAAVMLAFALGVLFVQPVQNLIAALTGLTARMAERLKVVPPAPGASGPAAQPAPGTKA